MREGISKREAMLEAIKIRTRPVLMTGICRLLLEMLPCPAPKGFLA